MNKIKKWYYLILITIITLLNLILVFNNNVWCDEAFVMNACKLDFPELIQYIYTTDMRPPVYLLAAKLFSMIFGLSVPALKIFSLIPAVLAMILGATVVDRNWGNGKLYTGSIFIILMGLAPITITKNIEISMYSWTAFFIVCSAIYAYNIVCNGNKKKDWIIFIISALGAATTHYYAVLTEIFIYLFLYIALLLLDKKNLKRCFLSAGVTILCYLPILPFFFHQIGIAKDTFWIKETNLGTMLSALRLPIEGENTFTFTGESTMFFWIFVFGIFFRLIINCIKSYIEKKELDKTSVFAVLCLLVILCFLFGCLVLSNLIRPLFVRRYMYVEIGLLWLYVAIVFGSKISQKTEQTICLGFIFCLFIFGYPSILNREYNTGTEQVVSYLDELMDKDDILINNMEECANWCLNYYFPEQEAYLDCDTDEFYKNELFDFSKLDTTAWYLCRGKLEIPKEVIEKENLRIEEMIDKETFEKLSESGVYDNLEEDDAYNEYNIDRYYYFSIYKITKE